MAFLSTETVLAEVPVKKSRSGICHDTTSNYYSKTKNYESYPTLVACINSGGRLPKGNTKVTAKEQVAQATQEAKQEGRNFNYVYNRDDWNHWLDTDGDCQNLRAELLIEQSLIQPTFTKPNKCTVKTGQWYDPFSNETYLSASQLQIDHIVPLKWAHEHGGATWTLDQKEQFANDTGNLLIVYGPLNGSKSAQGPDSWLPPYHPFRCDYIKSFDDNVQKYLLVYTAKEHRVISRMLAKCGH
ncbi:hypothetical protein A1QO_03905 [Vibrio genomosp. F10 str. ZF-129]|uniref:GmrSD restriction endonucleases C-terminal domain-containing protein n=1 Tax=Vibrio genomosp. F10 str. ZF-129 TaxID=1187848 RepID=A0A1E5BIQ7_9VIBR|nr:hypothetical protein A1QO_03905 [Vibrio genomosp. F10 str. ZF-129]